MFTRTDPLAAQVAPKYFSPLFKDLYFYSLWGQGWVDGGLCRSKNGVEICPNPGSLFLRLAGVGWLSPALGLCVLVVCSVSHQRRSYSLVARLNFLSLYKVMHAQQHLGCLLYK